MRIPLIRTLLGFLLFLSPGLSSSVALAAESTIDSTATIDTPIAEFLKNGEKIFLYTTEFPGVFVDQKQRFWIFETPDQTLADRLQNLRFGNDNSWQEKGEFILASPEQLAEFKSRNHLNPSRIQGVMLDARGDRWIFVTDPAAPNDPSKGRYVRLDSATPDEVLRGFAGPFDLKGIFAESLRVYGPEQLRFSAALWTVQMYSCFGGLDNLMFHASVYTPTCVDDFIHHLLSPQGMIGFYFFILTNRLSHKVFMDIILHVRAAQGKQANIPALRQKLSPLLGYIGMALGSIASSSIAFILSPPTWDECIKHVSMRVDYDGNLDPGEQTIPIYEGYANAACTEAFTHFKNLPQYLKETPGETLAMITAALLAAGTQQVAGMSITALTNARIVTHGMQVLGTSVAAAAESAGAIGNTIRTIQLVSNFAVVTGVPGIVVRVTIGLTSYVLFIAWDNIVRLPIVSEVQAIGKALDMSQIVPALNRAIDKTAALNNEKSFLRMDCHYDYDMQVIPGGYGPFTVPPILTNKRSVCETVSPLDEELKKFRMTTMEYLSKAQVVRLENASVSWKGKTGKYFNRYRASKLILEYIHMIKAANVYTNMDTWQAAAFYTAAWREALKIEVEDTHPVKMEALARFDKIEALVAEIEDMESVQSEDTVVSDIISALYYVRDMVSEYITGTSKKLELRLLLVETKNYLEGNINQFFPQVIGLGGDGGYMQRSAIYQAYREFNLIEFEKLGVGRRTLPLGEDNSGFLNDLISSVGEEYVYGALFDLFCGTGTEFKFDHMGDDGGKATIHPPFVFKSLGTSEQAFEYYDRNCTDLATLYPKYEFRDGDFFRTWHFQGRVYTDPLSMAIDKRTELVSGNTPAEAFQWWRDHAFPPSMNLIVNSAYQYNEVLQREIGYHIPFNTAEELIQSALPADGRNITPFWVFGSRMSTTLMAQTLYVLELVKKTRPGDATVASQADQVGRHMADLIISFRQNNNLHLLDIYNKFQVDVTRLNLTEWGAEIDLQTFHDSMNAVLFSQDSRQKFVDSMKALNDSSSALYKTLTGVGLDGLTADEIGKFTKGVPAKELRNFSKDDYKKYMYFKLLNENITDIAINYLTLDLYQKYSLQPLLETPQESL